MNFLKLIWQKWLPIAHAIGNFQAQVILTIFYLILLAPLSVIMRIFSDPLNLRQKGRSNFSKWEYQDESLAQAKKQY